MHIKLLTALATSLLCACNLVAQDWRLMTSSRSVGAVAWDPVRARIVLFDIGQSTWEWEGTGWVERDTGPSAPPPLTELAWDPVNLGVLAFGGYPSNETWLYDGLSWRQLSPANSPPRRFEHAMATDDGRGRVVVYGGADLVGGIGFSDTWEWDGSNWTRVAAPGAGPRNLNNARMAYDVIRQRMVLFGGNDQQISYSGSYWPETWEWDGVRWQLAEQVGPANGRDDPGMAFDPRRGRVLMHGGVVRGFAVRDTWEWDGTTWNRLANGPPGNNEMAFDTHSGTMLRVGADTWSFDGQAWSRAEVAPEPRNHPAIAFDPVRGRAVLYGRPQGSTWEHDGNRWILAAATSTNPTGTVWGPGLAWDASQPGIGEVLMYDQGITSSWDGANWRQRTAPGPTAQGTIVADTGRAEVVLYNDAGETWVWNAGAWTQRLVAGPPRRFLPQMAFDPLRGMVVLFGGTTSVGNAAGVLDDTWLWNGTAWTKASPAVSPPGRYDHAMAWDASSGEVVVSGGQRDSTTIGAIMDTWSFDGTTWKRRETSREPAWQLAMTETQPGRILAVDSQSLPLSSAFPGLLRTWEYDARPTATRTSFGTGCGSAVPPPGLTTLGLPRAGRSRFAIDVGQGPPAAPGVLMLSVIATNLHLGGGCSLYVDPAGGVAVPFVAGPTGAASQSVPIPTTALLGTSVHGQAALLDPGAPFAGIALTPRLTLDVGR